MKRARVIVAGGRKYPDTWFVGMSLSRLLRTIGPFDLVEGGGGNTDDAARTWAKQHESDGVVGYTFYAQWHIYKKRAGSIRNGRMLVGGANLLVAFPGDGGTADMYGQAKDKNVPVWLPASQKTIPPLRVWDPCLDRCTEEEWKR